MATTPQPHFVENAQIRRWLHDQPTLSAYLHSIGSKRPDPHYVEDALGLPFHLRFLLEKLADEHDEQKGDGDLPGGLLESIPFHSLCKGLLLPLSGLAPEKAAQVFGIKVPQPPDTLGREKLLGEFFDKEIGLSLVQKLACILGDPFRGRKSTFRRDSLIRLLESMQLVSRRNLLDRLAQVGDVAILFAENRPELRAEGPPLTAAEVLETLRFLPDAGRTLKFDILRSVVERCGKLEAYFLAKLMLRAAGFGFEYQGPLLARLLAGKFRVDAEAVTHALALTDAFHVVQKHEDEGTDGLRAIQLQPLSAVRPALASGTTDKIEKFPVWVEKKYDGIRLMLHKSTGATVASHHGGYGGSVLCAAYTRARNDWMEMIAGMELSIRQIPCHSVILDGELYGIIAGMEGTRPASVYDIYHGLTGDKRSPVSIRYVAFDVLYLNGRDLTPLPLSERRKILQQLIGPMQGMQTPIPFSVSEGQQADKKDDINRLYQYFRGQGFEGVIAKNLAGPYRLATRDPEWTKRKPAITLDLTLLAAVYAVTSKERAGLFGSYVIGALAPDGSFEDMGDVAGLDQVRDAEIQAVIMREGLLTGRRIERPSASGVRPGLELRP
ncbi:MAG: hypothetical protein AB7S36_03395, partial [Planctomycetota bacterium]